MMSFGQGPDSGPRQRHRGPCHAGWVLAIAALVGGWLWGWSWLDPAMGIVGAVLATYGGQALGLYQVGQPAGFFGSVVGAVVLLVLLIIF